MLKSAPCWHNGGVYRLFWLKLFAHITTFAQHRLSRRSVRQPIQQTYLPVSSTFVPTSYPTKWICTKAAMNVFTLMKKSLSCLNTKPRKSSPNSPPDQLSTRDRQSAAAQPPFDFRLCLPAY